MTDPIAQLKKATWQDLTEPQPFDTMTFIEQRPAFYGSHEHYGEWLSDGVIRLDFSRDEVWMDMLDRYAAARERLLPKDRAAKSNYWNGWSHPTPYLDCPELMAVGLNHRPLVGMLSSLLDDQVLLHLALTGWVSTERNWHQDSYLNPPAVWSGYVAVWIAMDDIHMDSGPFQFVPGSHRWDVLRREKLFSMLPESVRSSADWPTVTQGEVARVCEEKISATGAEIVEYIPRKGEVLVWHSNLVHRGSPPKDPEALRKSLILHYSAVQRRKDMLRIQKHGHGFYFKG